MEQNGDMMPRPPRVVGLPGVSDDDSPVESNAKMRDREVQRKRNKLIFAGFAVVLVLLLLTQDNPLRVIIAVAISLAIFMAGLSVLGALSRPVPEPPPPGELRSVKFKYRCSSCGTELKMTLANDAVPESPKHCSEAMDLVEQDL